MGGGEFEIAADNVVNATGVWADRIRPDELYAEEEVPRIRPSRGTHVTLSHEQAADGGGRDRAGRQGPHDVRAAVARAHADRHHRQGLRGRRSTTSRPSDDDVDYLLDAGNEFFDRRSAPGDLTGAYAGVRPLISTGDPKKSVDISRRAELYETSSGI